MEAQVEHSDKELKRLQRCIGDLVGVLALPAIWTGGGPSRIVSTLLDVLLGVLNLDLVYSRLNDSTGEASIEVVRIGPSRTLPDRPQEMGALLSRCLGRDPGQWPPLMRAPVGDGEMSLVSLRLGLHGEVGVIVAGSERADFPQQTETLLLTVAANQASIGLQGARLLSDQKRIASELDRRVEERTRELGAANAELAHLTRVMTIGALTASIAHEINQPLAGIITNASTCLRMLAVEPPNVEGARETARRTIRDGNRASDVITRLRALFSKKAPTKEWVDLNEAAREVIALSLSDLQRSRVILRAELADELPPVKGDRVQLQQVIMNLLRNASEAMSGVDDRPRQLVIKTGPDEADRVCLTVQDTGPGLDPHVMDRLFEAFYTTKNDGMGIGLSISRSIIEGHQGRLWATPNDGPGATFSFSIPRGRASTADADSVEHSNTPNPDRVGPDAA